MNLCVSCKHLVQEFHGGMDLCGRTKKIELVRGRTVYTSCHTERTYEVSDGCGPNAKYFEQAETVWLHVAGEAS